MPDKEFPARLQKLRESYRPCGRVRSRRVTSELCGLDKNAIGRFERGEAEPQLNAIVAISEYFGVTTDFLLKGE